MVDREHCICRGLYEQIVQEEPSLLKQLVLNDDQIDDQIYDECFSAFTATLRALFDTTLFDSVYKDEVDTSFKYWANVLSGDLHNVFSADAYDVHSTSMDQMYCS